LDATKDGAPPSTVERNLSFTTACSSKLVAVAMGSYVSAYSLDDGSRVWTRELDAPLATNPPLAPADGSASVTCGSGSSASGRMPIVTTKGIVYVELADGALRKSSP
jgi:hypothetical protein